MKLSKTQQRVVDRMGKGHRLWSDDIGFFLMGETVRTTTVSALLEAGYIEYDGRENNVQRGIGMVSLGLKKNND